MMATSRPMRLSSLDPHWLDKDGTRMGIVFKCPCCQTVYLSCFCIPTEHIAGDDYHDSQYGLFKTVLPDPLPVVVPCRRGFAWTFNPSDATFETLTITPSLDASASGHWHGFITNGECQ